MKTFKDAYCALISKLNATFAHKTQSCQMMELDVYVVINLVCLLKAIVSIVKFLDVKVVIAKILNNV